MNAGFIEPHDGKWMEVLQRLPHDVYHLPGYSQCVAAHEGGQPMAFYAEHGEAALLIPLVLRRVPDALDAPADWCDAASPYGYPGPVASSVEDPGLLHRFLCALRELGAERGVISVFCRLHPLLPMPADVLSRHGAVVTHGPTVCIELDRSLDQLWAETRGGHRREIRKLIEAGFTAQMDDWSALDAFIDIYRADMQRLGADRSYLFPDSYFTELRSRLGDCVNLCTVRSPEGHVAAAGLFLAAGEIVQYHLEGTAAEYRRQAPAKLMLDFTRRWARAAGYRVLHLGGGVGAGADSLFQFKAGFGSGRAMFRTFRLVLDEGRYAALLARGEGPQPPVDAGADFFPQYRAAARRLPSGRAAVQA